jgi:hypothetical protein
MVLASIGKAALGVKDGSFGFFVVNLVILRFNKQKIEGFRARLTLPTGGSFDDFFEFKKGNGGFYTHNFHLPPQYGLAFGMFVRREASVAPAPAEDCQTHCKACAERAGVPSESDKRKGRDGDTAEACLTDGDGREGNARPYHG